jgi:hypothetical protein
MADPPPPELPAAERSRPASIGAPRWVKVLGIVAIILGVLVVIAALAGLGGSHGPSRHAWSGAAQLASLGASSLDLVHR